MLINTNDKEFILAVKDMKIGDVLNHETGDLKLVAIFDENGGDYEERFTPTVLYKRHFESGMLFRKADSNVVIFVPFQVIIDTVKSSEEVKNVRHTKRTRR